MFFADFHTHSPFAYAVSDANTLENLALGARQKGLSLLGTGDFCHPTWANDLNAKLELDSLHGTGFYVLKDDLASGRQKESPVWWMPTVEISTIVTGETPDAHARTTHKVHQLVHVENLEQAAQIRDVVSKRAKTEKDGRPTMKNTSPAAFAELILQAVPSAVIVPAHAWTPWFGIFGSKGGYDSLRDAYEDQHPKIFAIETGMSSDPAMNWRVPFLDPVAMLSSSDAHSPHPWRLGRECNAFDDSCNDFKSLWAAVREKNKKKLLFTVEVDPKYGKYHVDGHRKCKFHSTPEETKKLNGICPVCKKPLTLGVEGRVAELAHEERPEGFVAPASQANSVPFKTLLPLHELLAAALGSTLASKKVQTLASTLLTVGGNELNVLLHAPKVALEKAGANERVVHAILENREGQIKVSPGFDGQYGELQL